MLNQEKFDANRTNLPGDCRAEILVGGNHAQFGDYGVQDGDGVPTITREEQMEQTAELFSQMLPQVH